MENTIFNDNNNDTIGFYKDLKAGLEEQAKDFIDGKEYEMAGSILIILIDLEEFKDSKSLLVLSDGNGMGYTIREYEKGN